MCGCARLCSDVSEIKLVLSIPPERATPISRRTGTPLRPKISLSYATTPKPGSAVWTSCAGAWSRSGSGKPTRWRSPTGGKDWPVWLGETPADPDQLKSLLIPYPSEEMTIWPVGRQVGNVKNKNPSLIEPGAIPG
jgi:hypothetical protein